MKLFGLILVIAFCAGHAAAQTGRVLSFCRDGKVYLRWKPERSPSLEGCNVYRKIAGGEWNVLSGTPVRRITDHREIRRILGTQAELFLGLLGISLPEKGIDTTSYLRFLASPKALSNFDLMCQIYPDFPLVMGEMYVDSLPPNAEVRYKITAIERGKEHEIALSEPINSRTNDVIPAIQTLEATPGDETILLKWPHSEHSLERGLVNGYNVYRSLEILGPYERVNASPIFPVKITKGSTILTYQEFADKFVANDTTYFYEVRSVNAFGFESAPSPMIQATPSIATVNPPTDFTAEEFGTGARLRWKNAGGTMVEVWKYQRVTKKYKRVFPVSEFQQRTDFWLDAELEEGEPNYYFIRLLSPTGKASRTSDTIEFRRPNRTPPSSPKGLQVHILQGKPTLSWKKNTEKDLAGYHIRRALAANPEIQFYLTDAPVVQLNFTDTTSLNPGQSYIYTLYAVDSAGNLSAPEAVSCTMK